MKTITLFNEEKPNLKQQVLVPVLPEKVCPNCGQKHQVNEESVEIEGFKGIKHVLFSINCPDEDGNKKFGKFCIPLAKNVVFMSYFIFRKEDILC